MSTRYFADDPHINPTIIRINQIEATLKKLLDNYNTVYTNYSLILNNPPSDIQTVFKYKTDVKNAYTTFLATPNITSTPVVSAAPGTSIGSVANSGTSTNTLQTAIDNYNTALSNARITLNSINTQITTNATSLNALVKEIIPIGNSNRAKIDAGVEKLLAKIDDMQNIYKDFNQLIEDEPAKLDANYEMSKIKTKSNFFKYILYLVFTVFVVGSLCLLHFFPSSAYLDMFIMALAGIIIVYYGYDYFENRNNIKL